MSGNLFQEKLFAVKIRYKSEKKSEKKARKNEKKTEKTKTSRK